MNNEHTASHFFQNRSCEYFPCHPNIPETDFNCLFCYCPLYTLGRQCGGSCTYTPKGVKSCRDCDFPHWRQNYPRVIARFPDIRAIVRRSDGEDP